MIDPHFEVTGEEAKGLLYGVLAMNIDQLRRHPEYPSVRQLIQEKKIRYRQADPDEHWQTYRELVEQVSRDGVAYGDCEDLAPALAAEDRVRYGVASMPLAYSPHAGLFHVVTAVPTSGVRAVYGGSWPKAAGGPSVRGYVLQDPSAAAGMGSFGSVGVRGKAHEHGRFGGLWQNVGNVVRAAGEGLGAGSVTDVARGLGVGVREGAGFQPGWAANLGRELGSVTDGGGTVVYDEGGYDGSEDSEMYGFNSMTDDEIDLIVDGSDEDVFGDDGGDQRRGRGRGRGRGTPPFGPGARAGATQAWQQQARHRGPPPMGQHRGPPGTGQRPGFPGGSQQPGWRPSVDQLAVQGRQVANKQLGDRARPPRWWVERQRALEQRVADQQQAMPRPPPPPAPDSSWGPSGQPGMMEPYSSAPDYWAEDQAVAQQLEAYGYLANSDDDVDGEFLDAIDELASYGGLLKDLGHTIGKAFRSRRGQIGVLTKQAYEALSKDKTAQARRQVARIEEKMAKIRKEDTGYEPPAETRKLLDWFRSGDSWKNFNAGGGQASAQDQAAVDTMRASGPGLPVGFRRPGAMMAHLRQQRTSAAETQYREPTSSQYREPMPPSLRGAGMAGPRVRPSPHRLAAPPPPKPSAPFRRGPPPGRRPAPGHQPPPPGHRPPPPGRQPPPPPRGAQPPPPRQDGGRRPPPPRGGEGQQPSQQQAPVASSERPPQPSPQQYGMDDAIYAGVREALSGR